MDPHPQDRYLINSILRACNILKCFSGDKTYFKITDLARQLHLDRSTTYRILLSLERCGLVEKDRKTGEFSLGIAAFEIGNTYLRKTDLSRISKSIMTDLALKVQETVHLAVLSDTEIVYIDKVDSPRALGMMSKIGQRAPVHCTGLGKVLLAFQTEEELSRIIREIRLKPCTRKTITSKSKLMEELEEVRKQEYALDRREHEEGIECIGAPIRDHLGEVIAALSISGPQPKINTPSEKRFVKEVRNAASQISSKLGYLGKMR